VSAHPVADPALLTDHPRLGKVAAIDGFRGLLVIGLLLYHHGMPWAQGAIFTVSSFFTLSGFLITALLLDERVRTGRISLRGFWVRRFRRLMPMSLLTLLGVVVFGLVFADGTQLAALRGDVIAALADVANWRFIANGQSYLEAFSTPSPVLHFWSLSIEEQFYLLFPLLVVGAVRFGGRSPTSDAATVRRRVGGALVVTTGVSVLLPFVFTMSRDRIYLGTDTRASEILMGGLLAVMLADRRLGDPAPPGRITSALRAVGPAAVVGAVAIWVLTPKTAAWIYQGGFAAYAVVSCVIVAASLDPVNVVARVFSWRVFVWLGFRSYGIYLVHFPLFMVLSPARTGLSSWPLLALRVTVSIGLAEICFRLVEDPYRRGRAVLGQPLRRVGPALAALVVVGLVGVTAGAETGSVERVLAGLEATPIAPRSAEQRAPAAPVRSGLPSATVFTLPGPTSTDMAPTDPPPTLVPSTAAPPTVTSSTITPKGGLLPRPMRRPDRPLRLLVLGDSTALFLGLALSDWANTTKVFEVANYGVLGCGLVLGGTEFVGGVERGFDPVCDTWPAVWPQAIADNDPDLIVVAGAFHDITDRRLGPDQPWERIGEPAFDNLLTAAYARAAAIVVEPGVPVLWLDNPPILEGMNHPDRGTNTPANQPERTRLANELLDRFVVSHPQIGVVRYAQFFTTWPGGLFDPTLRQDGVHVDYEGRTIITRWLGPELLEAYWQRVGR